MTFIIPANVRKSVKDYINYKIDKIDKIDSKRYYQELTLYLRLTL